MKRNTYHISAILLVLGIFTSFASEAQKRASPMKYVIQTVESDTIKISYSSPSVKERAIWGELVPYNKVWRTGANEATTLEITADMIINGEELLKGKYSLFTIPNEKEWTIIINSDAKQWGAYSYKENKDVLRFKVKPEANEMTEALAISADANGTITIAWEKLKVSFDTK